MNKTYEERWLKGHYAREYPCQLSGYLLKDGRYIDMVEKRDVDRGAFYRDDHRTISHVYNSLKCELGGNCMLDFMKRGNIRFSPESDGFEMIVEPTQEQYEAMSDYERNYSQRRFEVCDERGICIFSSEWLVELEDFWYRKNNKEDI